MWKRVFVLLVVILFMVACDSAEYEEVNCETYEASIPTETKVYLPPMLTPVSRPHENASMPTNPHPFAAALREYMEGYDGVVRAYLVTLDDDGTMGVLNSRTPTVGLVDYDWGEYGYISTGTLFFIQDGELFQIDASGVFVAGRYNRLMQRFHGHTHVVEIIYKLEFGMLEISTRLEYFSDEYLSYLFDDEYDVVAEFIAERDALAEYAREKYGLIAQLPPNFGHMRNTDDQTAYILAMTMDCVPSLD